jgi:hypothetical protein
MPTSVVMSRTTATAVSSPAAETAILVSPVVQAGLPVFGAAAPPSVRISVTINITTGTTATALVARLRQGNGVGGTVVQAALTFTCAATTNYQLTFVFEDTSNFANTAGGVQYTFTLAETGAGAAGTVNAVDMQIEQ